MTISMHTNDTCFFDVDIKRKYCFDLNINLYSFIKIEKSYYTLYMWTYLLSFDFLKIIYRMMNNKLVYVKPKYNLVVIYS